MSGTGQLPELESLRTQLADVARALAERDRTLQEQTIDRDHRLQDLQEQSALLRTMMEGTATETGEQFFTSLVNHLTSTLQVQYAVIGTVTETAPHTIHTIAVSSGGALVRNFEYALSQTPCEAALKESFARFDSRVQDTFPAFEQLVLLGVDSYCGVPIRTKGGAVIGILAIMDTKPLRNSEWLQSVLTLFASRAGTELQRQRVEITQRITERRLRFTQFAVDQSFDGVLWADDSTRFIYANDAVCRSLGYSREELLGLTIADIAPGHDPERFQQRLDKIKQGGATTYESVHRRKDGSEFPIEVSVTYLEYEGTGYTCGIIRDITERQRVEQERLQALTDLRNITETVPDFMFTLDTQGNMVKWNRRVEEVTGYSPEELHGKSALAFVPAHEQKQTALAIQRAFTDGKAELEGHLITKDQRTIPYHWTGAVLKDPQGRIIGITGIGRDVSEQRQTAEALQRQRQHLLEAQALAHLGSWEWDIESGETDWSEEHFRIFGYEPGTIAVTYDTFLAALLPDDHDRVLAAVNDALLGKCPLDLECRIVRPNGDIRVVHMRADVQRDATAHPIAMAGTALDITERKQAEDALRASEERWHLAVQGSHDGIWDWNIQTGEIFFSGRWKAMRGFADHEVRNHIDEWRSRIHPDDLDRVLQSIDHYLAKQTAAFCEEYRVQRKDGSYMWTLDRGVALWAEDGTPIRMAGSETDITEHRQTLLQLEEQDMLLRSILDAEPECVKRVAADGTLLHMNKAGLGFIESDALEQVAGRSVYGLIAPESLEQFRRMHDAVIRGNPQTLEFQVVGLKGRRRWLETHAVPLSNPIDHRVEHLAVTRDVTERKQAEGALRNSQEKLQQALRASHTGLWDWNTDTNETSFSREWKQQLGYEETELANSFESWESHLHPEDHDRVIAYVQAYLANPEGDYQQEFRLRHKDGSYRWIEARAAFVTETDGRRVRLLGSHTDITERKRAELALRDSEARTRSILETALDAVVSIDESGLIIGWNTQAEIMFGYPLHDVLGRPLDDTIIPARYRQAHSHGMNRIVRGGGGSATKRRFEFFALHRSGREFPVEFAIATSHIDGQSMFTAFIRDITERKQAVEALRESEERFNFAIEATSDGIWDWNIQTGGVHFSPQWIRLLGYQPDEVVPSTEFFFTIVHPDDVARTMQILQEHLEGCIPVKELEVRLRQKSGEYRWYLDRGKVVTRDPKGNPLRMVGTIADITERKRAEEAVTRSYDLLKSFVEHTPAAVAMLDKDLRYVAVSRRWLQDYRLGDQELVGKRHYDVFPEISAMNEWRAIHQRCLAGAVERREEDRFVRADGSEDWLRWEVRPWQDVMGHIGGIIMFTEVITERKRAEEALRASEERLRLSLEAANQGIYDINVQTGEAHVSPGYATMLGYDPGSFRETNADWIARLHPHDRTRVQTYYRDYIEGKTAEYRVEFRQCARNGEWRWILSLGRIVERSPKGEPLRMVGTHTDITERKQAEEALRDTNYMLQALIETSPLAIIGLDQEGTNVTRWNPAAETIFGWRAAEVLGHPLPYIPTEDQTRSFAVWEETTQTGVLTGKELQRLRKDGSSIDVAFWSTALKDAQGTVTGTFAFIADITDRKRTEEALTRSERQLRTVLDTLPIGVWFTNEKGRVLYGNPVGHRIWAEVVRVGLPQPGGDSRWWETIDKTESLHRWAVGTVLAQGKDVPNETLEIETDGGERRTLRNSAVLVKGDEGEILGAIVLNEDITDRVRAEQGLRQEHALLMAVMDAATDIIFVKDIAGRYIHMNRAGAETLGMALEEVIGWNEYALWPSDLAASCQLADRRVLESGEPVTVEETSVSNGKTTIYLTTKAPYRDPEGRIIGIIGVARDITERKNAEEALRASEELFAKAFQASPNPVGITEVATGRCIDANQACLDLLGFSREEVVGQTTLMLGIWPNPKDREKLITRLQTSGPMRNEEMTFSTKSGKLLHILVSSDLVEMNGKTCLITVGNDITERIRAEEALREQHALLSAIMNTTMDIIFVKDLEGHYLHMNPAGARMVGLSPQEVVGKDDDAIWPADLTACCKDADRQILSTGCTQTMEESTLANGKRTTYLTTKAPYRDAAGNMIGIIGVAHDISQIKQSEEDLRRSHAFIRQIIDTNPNFIFAKDREGRFTLVNKAVAEAYGTTVERLIGKTDADFNSNTRELAFFRKKDLEVLDSLLEQFIAEEMITDVAGHTRWLQTVKRPILDESGKATMVLGASTDITERKRIEETLLQRERDLRTALDERERISQDLHDGILQSLYAVGLGLEACKPLMTQRHYKKAAASMDRAIGHLNHVMSEVRNFIAGLESQILQGSTFPMALRTMVLTLTADHPTPCILTIDESLTDTFSTEQALHLLNIVREALSNSLRHAEATKTTISLKSLSRSIRLTIVDNGRGFDPASLRGTGHGLANMEARVLKIGGRFAIRSVPQHGTRITIDLPKETRHAESESEHGSTAARR